MRSSLWNGLEIDSRGKGLISSWKSDLEVDESYRACET